MRATGSRLAAPARTSGARPCLGCKERGTKGDGPFDHATGKGWVAPHEGKYSHALGQGREVWVLVAEVTGALDETFHELLQVCSAKARIPNHRDGTRYGMSRAATRSFCAHHMRMFSLAVAMAVAISIAEYNSAVKSDLVDATPDGAGTVRAHSG